MDEFIERLSDAGPIAPEQVRVDPQRGLWSVWPTCAMT